MLHNQFYRRSLILLILVNNNYWFCCIWNFLINNRSLVLRILDSCKEFLYFCFYMVNINISYNDNSLVRWMIPLVIVINKFLSLEIVNNTHQTNWIAKSILATRIESRKIALKHTAWCTCTQTPLLVNNTTFLVYLLLFKTQSCRPVTKDEQTTVESRLTCCWNIINIVNSLINTCESIQVATKFNTYWTAPLY